MKSSNDLLREELLKEKRKNNEDTDYKLEIKMLEV